MLFTRGKAANFTGDGSGSIWQKNICQFENQTFVIPA